MKKNLLSKNIHQWLLLLVCFMGTIPTWAYTYVEDGVIYDIDASTNTAKVLGLEYLYTYSVTINEYIGGGRRVTSIEDNAFKDCSNLTSVDIPNSVESIGNSAFSGCYSLTSITIPNSVTNIGDNAFSDCSNLTSVDIPNSVTSIGSSAFSGCSSLTSITIPNSVTEILDGTFDGCSSLTSIIIPNSVTSIGGGAFSGCSSLTSITIPNSVTSIGGGAFYECSSLTSITIPNSVTEILDGTFDGCSSLSSVTIGRSVTNIDNSAFDGCSSLASFTIDESNPNFSAEGLILFNKDKTKIFLSIDKNIKNYTIPNSVTSIGSWAFDGCSSLTSITIPNSVTSIGSYAFDGCSSLTSITIPNSVTSIGSHAFYGCSSLTSITIPNSVTSIGNYAFYGCTSLTSITIPNSVTSIGDYAFLYCSSLTSITIPSSVTSIGSSAFNKCTSLTSFSIDESNPNYSTDGLVVFNKDKTKLIQAVVNIKSYTIPNSVTSIDNDAFYGCTSLTSITIPNSVTSIGRYTFSNCTSINSITIPSSVTGIGEGAFNRCISLKTVYFQPDDHNLTLGKWIFSGDSEYPYIYYMRSGTVTLCNGIGCVEYKDHWHINDPRSDSEFDNYLSGGGTWFCYDRPDFRCYDGRQVGRRDFKYHLLSSVDDLQALYTKANEVVTPNYLPLASSYTAGSNILTSADQLSTNKPESEGPISNLVDGDKNTFFHSTWSANNVDKAFAYLQIDLKGSYKDLLLDYTKRYNFTDNKGYPTQFHVFATNTPNDEESWKDCGYSNQLSYRYDNQQSGKTILNLDGDYQYIRLQVEKTGGMDKTNDNLYFALGELAIYPVTNYKNAPYTEKDGLITDASQLSSNAIEPQEGSLAELIDNDITTYFHSTWSQNNVTGAKHYLQVDLNDAYRQIALKYSKRQVEVDNGSPVTLHVYATNTPEDANSWTDLGTQTCAYDYDFGNTGLLPLNFGDTAYRHIRLTVEETTGNSQLNGNLFFYWSELHAYTRASQADKLSEATRTALITAMQQARAELDAELATDATYETLQSAYNAANNEISDNSQFADFAKSFYLTAYSDKALVVPAGVKAAVVTANGEGIRNDYRYNSGDVIPAGTGVLLKGGKGNSFYLSASESTEMAPEDNLLHGTLTDEMTSVVGADKYYKLSYDRATGTEIGFYWGAANGGAFMNKGGKAFLAIPATLQAAQLTGFSLFDLDNNQVITGIEHATATPAATLRVYDLNGRRINVNHVDELPQGIYVINGKKVIR